MKRTSDGLTERQRRFVDEFLVDQNAHQAMLRAGLKDAGRAHSPRLMADPRIKAAIAQGLAQQQERTLISADKVLLDIQSIGDDAWKAEDYNNALRSRELLGKRYKLFTDKVEVTNNTPRAERLKAARERRSKP